MTAAMQQDLFALPFVLKPTHLRQHRAGELPPTCTCRRCTDSKMQWGAYLIVNLFRAPKCDLDECMGEPMVYVSASYYARRLPA